VRLLGGQRQLLDREVEPDRKRQGREDPRDAVRQEGAAALIVGRDVGEVAGIEGPADEHGHVVEREDAECQHGDDHGEAHGDLDAENVDADEEDVVQEPPENDAVPGSVGASQVDDDVVRQETHRAHDDRRGDDVFHVLGQAVDEAAPWPHRGPGEGVGASGVRHRR
jgi:hypothetical protein